MSGIACACAHFPPKKPESVHDYDLMFLPVHAVLHAICQVATGPNHMFVVVRLVIIVFAPFARVLLAVLLRLR